MRVAIKFIYFRTLFDSTLYELDLIVSNLSLSMCVKEFHDQTNHSPQQFHVE